jgi:hypothetical protein
MPKKNLESRAQALSFEGRGAPYPSVRFWTISGIAIGRAE